MICQEAARATVDPGDSGSPVFMVTNDPAIHDVRLAGILWGETTDTAGSEFFLYSLDWQRPTRAGHARELPPELHLLAEQKV